MHLNFLSFVADKRFKGIVSRSGKVTFGSCVVSLLRAKSEDRSLVSHTFIITVMLAGAGCVQLFVSSRASPDAGSELSRDESFLALVLVVSSGPRHHVAF